MGWVIVWGVSRVFHNDPQCQVKGCKLLSAKFKDANFKFQV